MAIPNSTRKPSTYLEENVRNAIQGLYTTEDKVCIIAQMTTGTAPSGTPMKCFSDADGALYFGSGSPAHLALRAAFQQNPSVSGYTVVGAADQCGGAPASGQIDISSIPTTGGVVTVWIGTATASQVVASLVADSSSVSTILPVIVTGSTSTLAFAARNSGRIGNMIPIKVSETDGLQYTITPMTSGANDPDVGDYDSTGSILNSVVGGGYTVFVNTIPNNVSDHDSATKVQNMVEFLSGDVEEKPCIQVIAATDLIDTYANVKTLCETDINKGRCTCAYLSYANTNTAGSEYYKVAAAYAADIVSQSDDPALPYNNDVLTPIAPPAVTDRLTRTQQEDCLHNGVTPLEVIPGEQVAIVKAITTYVFNSLGNPDPTLLNVNTYRVLDFVRAQMITTYQSKYGKSKITARLINSVKDTTYNTLKLIEVLEIVKDVDLYKNAITAVINPVNPSRIDVSIPTAIVSPLDIIAGSLNLIIS